MGRTEIAGSTSQQAGIPDVILLFVVTLTELRVGDARNCRGVLPAQRDPANRRTHRRPPTAALKVKRRQLVGKNPETSVMCLSVVGKPTS